MELYVGRDKGAIIVREYDQHVLLPLLVVVSKHLNLGCVEGPPPSTPINDDSLWEPKVCGGPSSFNTHR